MAKLNRELRGEGESIQDQDIFCTGVGWVAIAVFIVP
jgi:hypothetical protein